ncbi:MAG: tetratricopeptide repeat protein, partial [Crocosphaera sp.]|nr:tetratricopeptide repeat protein [Crocosphaera sp.]
MKLKFALNHNGIPIRTLDKLRKKCDIDQLLKDYRDGRLCRWLKAQKNSDYLISGLDNISAKDDLELAKELVKIIDIERKILAKAYNNHGVNYSNLEEYQKAIADFTQAIELNPNYAEAYNNRGNAYGNLEEYQKAIADFTKTIELNPNYAE